MGGQLHQLNDSDARNGVGVHYELVSFGGGLADIGPGIQIVPTVQPRGHGVLPAAGHVQRLHAGDGFRQLPTDF